MRKITCLAIILVALDFLDPVHGLLTESPAAAQQVPPASIQNSPSHLDAGGSLLVANASATTYTITPQPGQYVYINWINISNCEDATGISAAAAPTSITTTNMQGLTYQIASGAATAGSCPQQFTDQFAPGGLKASAPGPVTFVTPTFITHQTVTAKISWNSAP